MASKTDIANRALSKLGEGRVSNIDTDDNTAPKVIRFMWDIELDTLLTAYPWNFAVTRTQIAKNATAPSWGYANSYTLPSDFLALLEINQNPDYRLETDATNGGRLILTDSGSPLKIRYIKRVTDTGEFDPLFVQAFASKLALEGCEEITQSNTKKEILVREYLNNIREAYASDAIQDPPLRLQSDEWLVAREQSVIFDEIDYQA